jgi:hypothetical protein
VIVFARCLVARAGAGEQVDERGAVKGCGHDDYFGNR